MKSIFAALPAGVQGEVFTVRRRTTQARFANSQFEETTHSTNTRTTLRVIGGGRLSASSSGKPGSGAELVENCLETVRYGTRVNYEFPGPAELPSVELYDETVTRVELPAMVALAEELNAAVVACDPRIRAMASVRREVTEVTLANTRGFSGSYQKTGWSVHLGGRLIQGEDMLWIGDGESSCTHRTDYSELQANVTERFRRARATAGFAAGSYPVIFAPAEVGFLLRPLVACLDGKAVARGISPWRERLGQQLLDPRLNVIDDGTLPWHPTSAPFDREGTPTRRNVLIAGGVPSQLLLDLESAHELGLQPSGNGGPAGNPAPHHLSLTPGSEPLADLIANIKCGLIVYGSMGAWTGNPYSGMVSGTVALGLKIEDGALAGRVKNCMFSLNAFEHLRHNLIGISAEVKTGNQATFPYVAVDSVVISTR